MNVFAQQYCFPYRLDSPFSLSFYNSCHSLCAKLSPSRWLSLPFCTAIMTLFDSPFRLDTTSLLRCFYGMLALSLWPKLYSSFDTCHTFTFPTRAPSVRISCFFFASCLHDPISLYIRLVSKHKLEHAPRFSWLQLGALQHDRSAFLFCNFPHLQPYRQVPDVPPRIIRHVPSVVILPGPGCRLPSFAAFQPKAK